MSDTLDKLEAVARAATPGPWRWWTSNSVRRLSSDATGKDGDVLYAFMHPSRTYADIGFPNGGDEGPDAAHIAAFNPKTARALVKVARAAKRAYRVMDTLIPNEDETDALAEALGELFALEELKGKK